LIFYAKTYPKIQTGHPFDKTYSVNSSLSEDVFKKCGKQEVRVKAVSQLIFIIKYYFVSTIKPFILYEGLYC